MAKPGTKRSRPQSEDELVANLETQVLPLAEVTPHPDNPKTHTEEQVEAVANGAFKGDGNGDES